MELSQALRRLSKIAQARPLSLPSAADSRRKNSPPNSIPVESMGPLGDLAPEVAALPSLMPHAIPDLSEQPSFIGPTRKEKDIALWERWKQSRSDADLSALYQQFNPVIQKEVNKWAGTLARPVLEAEAKKYALTAFERYSPTAGAALGSYVTDWVKKISRLSYAHQNLARLPENKMLQFHTYNVANAHLSDTLGRQPTSDELADELAWSTKRLEQFQKDIRHQELLETGGARDEDGGGGGVSGLPFQHEESDNMVHFIHHDLPPVQKQIFEHLTGFAGAHELSNQDIMTRLNLTQGQYSYQKRLLINRIEDIMKGHS